mmetsp:Transcript_7649/g.9206  ORF Transcript_7649/g.9206 Transcript_7649/m.9206 type:complete len:85 (-) Transcript_7649:1798-2052(-)
MMRRGIKKVEMVDAWTQTSPRKNDEEAKKQQQQQQLRSGMKHGEHARTVSNGNNNNNAAGFIFTDGKNKPRASVEHIYNGSDPK